MSERYDKPPITEAVIELRFESPLSDEKMESVSKKFSKHFPFTEKVKHQEFSFKVIEKPEIEVIETFKYRITDESGVWIVVVSPKALSLSRLPPYYSFEDFERKFETTYNIFLKSCGYRKITRVGVRYLNRIDVPIKGNIARYEDYFNLKIDIPNQYDNVFDYNLHFVVPLSGVLRARIASGTMEPALIDHASFLLDIDVFCEIDPPQKERDIANILLEMRESKNYLFGTFVSDKAKATFCAS